MATSTPTKATVVLLAMAIVALICIDAAVIPQSSPDKGQDLDSLKAPPSLDSEESLLEAALQSPQVSPGVVDNDKNLKPMEDADKELSDTDDDDDDDGDNDDDDDDDDDDGVDAVSDNSEQELEDLRPGEPGNRAQLHEALEDELQAEDIQENKLREGVDAAREYEKALQAMSDHEEIGPDFKEQTMQDEADLASEETSPTEDDYEGYGLDDEDDDDDEDEEDYIEITEVNRPVEVASEVNSHSEVFKNVPEAQIVPSNAHFTPEIPESFSLEEDVEPQRPYLDDAIVSEDDVMHDDVKRGDKMLKLPGHPALRVIELNETLYLNNTDDNEPKFQPVRIPDKFENYDVNRDGLISLPEVRHVTGAVEGAKEAFRDADRDGDGWVERDEFDLAGWGMQMNPSPTSPPQRRVVFIPREDLHPSSIPRGPDDVSSRRQYGRRRH